MLTHFSRFSPETLNLMSVKGLSGWFLQVALLKMSLVSLGSTEALLLDIVAYAGYTFVGLCLAVLGRIMWNCLLFHDALGMSLHRYLLCEDNEKSSFC